MSKTILNIVCLLLVIAGVATLFLPCWEYEEDDTVVSVSAANYILDPGSHKPLTRALRDVTDNKKLTVAMALPIFVLMLGGIALSITSLLKIKTAAPALSCLALGTAGSYLYLTNVILKVGAMWSLHLVLYAVMLGVGVLQMLLLRKAGKEKKAK